MIIFQRQVHRNKACMGAFLAGVLVLMLLCPLINAGAAGENRFSDIVEFRQIALYHSDGGTAAGDPVGAHALIEKGAGLVLRYEYEIQEKDIPQIKAETPYYLEVTPHLVLPDLTAGSPLYIETENGPVEFGTIHSDKSRAWVVFRANADGDTVLSEYGGLENAHFYLNCRRADAPPKDEAPIDGKDNLYAMKFEDGGQLEFGYAELEPVSAKAQIKKDGSLAQKTITWTIEYTPWQNPSPADGVTMDTLFELHDTIDGALHTYVKGSVRVDGTPVADSASRDDIAADMERYVIAEYAADGDSTMLTFGGTKLKAGSATQGDPAKPMKITYETTIRDELLLPGGAGGQKITNAAQLFAGTDTTFHPVGISANHTISVKQPDWIEKKGTTTRVPGDGSFTEWEVTFYPNGFTFGEDDKLTLHDQLPGGSALVDGSVQVDGQAVTAVSDNANGFTISPIAADRELVITYRTKVDEDMYDSGTSLGENVAWCSFQYDGKDYTTPTVTAPVGSGDGTGTPSTATLLKTNSGYNAAARTIEWTVTINPHKANLKGGIFSDDLGAVGGNCGRAGHPGGLELVGGAAGVAVLLYGAETADRNAVQIRYDGQVITAEVANIGTQTVTLRYTTKVCDPCIFAGNIKGKNLTNTIITENMVIGDQVPVRRSADSTADLSVTVLTKKAPVYEYDAGTMRWTVEVDAAGLPMEDIVLTDVLPKGLTYKENSLATNPEIAGASAVFSGQELTIKLGSVTGRTTVTFDTSVSPEEIGFNSDGAVTIANTIAMNGRADGVEFAEVSHKVTHTFTNHGLVKSSAVNSQEELIKYEVLINPFGLALPENPSLVDTLDKRLQLDADTLYFYEAKLSGTTDSTGQKPSYTKTGSGTLLKLSGYDPETNSFTVPLPVSADSRAAYVLCYTADIIERQTGGYGNSVRFEGGSVLLGGSKNNSASVGGGGGGGGGGVAARKAAISVRKTDSESGQPLAGVTFTLYQWDSANNQRGLPFARKVTDADGKLTFQVKPGAVYALEETAGISGYDSVPGWGQLPAGVTQMDHALIVTAGAAKTELVLNLTNRASVPENPGDGGTGDGGLGDGGSDGAGSGGDGGSDGAGSGGDGGSGATNGSEGGGSGGTTAPENPGVPDQGVIPGVPDAMPPSDHTQPAAGEDALYSQEQPGIVPSPDAGDPSDAVPQSEPVILRDVPSSSADNGSGAPKTGDTTIWLAAVAVLSGILLAILTLYHLWLESVRRRK